MAAERVEHSANPRRRQGGRYVAAPGEVIQLLDLREIHAMWGFSEHRIYRAVARHEIRAYGRLSHQKYYSRAELVHAFGEPTNGTIPPASKRQHRASDVSGDQLSWPEIAASAEAA